MDINPKFPDWLYDIARAIFVIKALPPKAPLTDYAKLTVKIALDAIGNVRRELDKVEARFKAIAK